MDLEFTDELRNFHQEVRAFIEERLPVDLRKKVERFLKLGKEDYLRWQDILAEKGWLVYSWAGGARRDGLVARATPTSSRRRWAAPTHRGSSPSGRRWSGR